MTKKELLQLFVKEQLKEMASEISHNFDANMSNRKNNPFNCLCDDINKYMGLGRSFDSQLGNRLQNIAFYCARLKYGDICVPNIVYIDKRKSLVKAASIQSEYRPGKELKSNVKPYNQYIIAEGDFSVDRLRSRFGYKKSTSDDPLVKEYSIDFDKNYTMVKKDKTPVDLLILFEKDKKISAYAFEIKAGGNLDTKNSKANKDEVENLEATFSFAMGNNDTYRGYFATCYQNADTLQGDIFRNLNKGQIMIGEKFWKFILPEEISYDEFISIYNSAFVESNIEITLKSL